MTEARGSVTGSNKAHEVRFYGISTCVWCKRTRQFLEENNVQFEFTYVDLLTEEEKDQVRETVRQWNPRESFPTVIIDNAACVVGYRPNELKQALGL